MSEDELADYGFDLSGAWFALNRGLKLGWLDCLDPWYDIPQMATLSGDADTALLASRGAWSDKKGNYFLAGQARYPSGKTYYIINDKLYDPNIVGADMDHGFLEGEKLSSHWLFGGFVGDVPLVKRIVDYKKSSQNLTGDTSLDAEYILETCELQI